jgi:type III secretion protein V
VDDGAGGRVIPGRVASGGAPAFGWLARHLDMALAIAVVAIFGMMIVPVPAGVLDVLIATNLALAALLLALTLQVTDALQISAFPSLLLLTTLFRLGLEISATRLVLLRASAGQVIHAFGSFVVGGSLVVGLVVFLILTLVQYIVISKGAERVAEVAARFTLDAMPGKQMAIDAELRGGFIDAGEARRRRGAIARESQLFGSMDGAMKFVKGDAIAGLVILAINLVGGLAIGVLEHGMALRDAVRTYAILTIGGGLVAQLPALVISTAAGIVVTRVASEEEGGSARLGIELGRQLGEHPKAFAVASALLLVLAAVPGLPPWPFLLLGAGTGALAWRQFRVGRAQGVAADSARLTPPPYVVTRAVTLVLGSALMDDSARVAPPRRRPRWHSLLTTDVRAALSSRLGLSLSRLRIETGAPTAVAAHGYDVRLDDAHRSGGSWEGFTRGGGAMQMELARRLASAIAAHAGELVGVQETDAWLADWHGTHPTLVREVVPKLISLPRLTDLLRALVGEGVSLRHGVPIFEALASQGAGLEGDAAATLERVRGAIGRSLVTSHLGGDHARGPLRAIELEAIIEDTIRDGVRDLGVAGRKLAIEPQLAKDITTAIAQAVASTGSSPPLPVILTQKELRRHVRGLIAATLPEVAVLAFSELPADVSLEYVGRARIG